MSAVYTLGPVFLDDGAAGTLLDQVTEVGYSDGVQRMLMAADGGPDVSWSAIPAQNPGLSFATTDLFGILALNSATFLYKGLALSASNIAEFYFQQAEQAAALWAGAKHLKLAVNEGMLVPRGLAVSDGGAAVLTVGCQPTWDGSNDPVTITANQSLPGTPAVDYVYTLGPVVVNAITLTDEVLGLALDTGLGLRLVRGGGRPYPHFVGIQRRAPSIAVRLNDAGVLATLGLNGAAITSGHFYLRRLTRASLPYSDASEQHIKITFYQGMANLSGVSISGDTDGEPDLLITPTKKAANEMFTIATGVAIT